MITIRCARCGAKLFRYVKIGKGRVLHLWKDRISVDSSITEGELVRCECGNPIGRDEGRWIRMYQNSFYYTGRVTK